MKPINRREAGQKAALAATGLLAWLSQGNGALVNGALAQELTDGELVPFLNEPRTPPNRLDWEVLDTWLTPQDQVFSVQHYGVPKFDYDSYRLDVGGLVDKSLSLTLADIKARPKSDVTMVLECAGNGSNDGFMNAVCNNRWSGTPLMDLLDQCGINSATTEIVFFGKDTQEEVLRPGTKRELKVEVPFGRSMSIDDARRLAPLLAYERNGEPIEHRNGAPIRLIVPGWYGVANVKWLSRIECRDRRYMGRYMARDYVTVRGERQGDEVVFVETSVTRINLKSVVARVTRKPTENEKIPLHAFGVAWDDGTGIERVEVKVDEGPWQPTNLDVENRSQFGWTFFSIELPPVSAGEHTIVSRAIDAKGRIQPTAEDDEIALKRTYWEAYQQWPRSFSVEA
ncbi:MAG: molybdopterin-dependent oxidoreductase [Planctomycetales bacterium]|nr:molybdopterin-dependent oxidoreductase [Planctomycetales bacterium]